MHNLTYTQFKHEIKKAYNIKIDDLPVYKIGIIKYFYKQQSLLTGGMPLEAYTSKTLGRIRRRTLNDYIKEVINNER